jgi:hypothetical protein
VSVAGGSSTDHMSTGGGVSIMSGASATSNSGVVRVGSADSGSSGAVSVQSGAAPSEEAPLLWAVVVTLRMALPFRPASRSTSPSGIGVAARTLA